MLGQKNRPNVLESLSCNLRVFDDNQSLVGKCELIFLERREECGLSDLMLIASRGSFNPLGYFRNVKRAIQDCLFHLNTDASLEDFDKYFDLFELRGPNGHSFVHWLPDDSLDIIDVHYLADGTLATLAEYYNSRWTLFADSLVNNNDKADLVALALSQTCFDQQLARKLLQQITARMHDYSSQVAIPTIGEKIVVGTRFSVQTGDR
ncbi:MAG TPA: hypothetical protein DDZ53_00215 [Firmicutes bacterium]|nr:hypothetical protein [Bacillota bacterium]